MREAGNAIEGCISPQEGEGRDQNEILGRWMDVTV